MLGDRLKDSRIKMGLTQEDLSRATGFHVTAISQWETGARVPSLGNFAVLCTSLKVSPGKMLLIKGA